MTTASAAGALTAEFVAWDDPRAVELRAQMSAEIDERYRDRFDGLGREERERTARALVVVPEAVLATVLVLDESGQPVGHAAARDLDGEFEVKRVFVAASARGRGVASRLMRELEQFAQRRGESRVILQTGDRQPEAVALYGRLGYSPIPAFAPYDVFHFSRCFEKVLGRAGK